MTAEALVMNRLGVGIAADSAVTIGQKILTSADKLFQLSSEAPVGIMIYGSGSIAAVPWEIVIKTFRKEFALTTLGTLAEYAEHFLKFLSNSDGLFPENIQIQHLIFLVDELCDRFSTQIKQEIFAMVQKGVGLSLEIIPQIAEDLAKKNAEIAINKKKCNKLDRDTPKFMIEEYGKLIADRINLKLPNLAMSNVVAPLKDYIVHSICNAPEEVDSSLLNSGIVITGFGESEFYPTYIHVRIITVLKKRLFCDELERKTIITAGENIMNSCVSAFAQKEMVQTFMYGVAPDVARIYAKAVGSVITNLSAAIIQRVRAVDSNLADQIGTTIGDEISGILDRFTEEIGDVSNAHAVEIHLGVRSLPKDELGAMAEALVNLTKFRRRVSYQQETVGGPIDVAVITKGDGFVWIKRKHYFPPELNPRVLGKLSRRQNESKT